LANFNSPFQSLHSLKQAKPGLLLRFPEFIYGVYCRQIQPVGYVHFRSELREKSGMKINRGITFLLGLGTLLAGYGRAGDTLPGQGYPASRYEALWTKSPFIVATSDVANQSSDFLLVGICRLDGVDYASLVSKQTNERYLLASGEPQNGLSLISVTHGEDWDKALVVIQNKGETFTLKLTDTAPAPMGLIGNAAVPGRFGQPWGAPQGRNAAMFSQTGSGFPSTMATQGGAPMSQVVGTGMVGQSVVAPQGANADVFPQTNGGYPSTQDSANMGSIGTGVMGNTPGHIAKGVVGNLR
jgi:hypothetical protein